MVRIDGKTLATDCGGVWNRLPAVPVQGFSIDSRTIRAGEIFVALQTDRRDGHEFLGVAADRGAAGAIVSSLQVQVTLPQLQVPDTLDALQRLGRSHRARFTAPVIGVTGSAGKTSTKDLLGVILGEPGTVHATEGNLNNHLGVPLTLLRLDPGAHRFAVIEAGISGTGEMPVLATMIRPTVAIITNVGPAHLDRLGTVEGVSVEKAALAHGCAPGGVAFFPASCLRFDAFRAIAQGACVVVPSGETMPDIPVGAHAVPYGFEHTADGTALCVTWHGTIEEFQVRRLTPGMASNAALAIAVALHLGVERDAIRARLPRWQPASLRGEVREVDGRMLYLDCYNANPASMLDALEGFLAAAREHSARLFVVGCMEELGADAAALHQSTGAHWKCGAGDRFVVFGTHADAFAAGVRSVRADAELLINPEHASAAAIVREFRGPVFVKGSRRYELEKLVGAAHDSHARMEAAVV